MTQTAINYAKVLYELQVNKQSIEEVEKIFREVSEIGKILSSPVISRTKKKNLINQIFPEDVKSFLKMLCDNERIPEILNICTAYNDLWYEKNHILRVSVCYANLLTEEKKKEINQFLCEKYPSETYEISYQKKEELIGGTWIKVGNIEYDNSYEGHLHQLELRLIGR